MASAGRDQLIPDGVNFLVMETAGSSCQCIQASSEFLPKVDTSDVADQHSWISSLSIRPYWQVMSNHAEIFEEIMVIW